MLARWLWPHKVVPSYLSSQQLAALRAAVLDSPYLAATDLNEGFEGTSGFTLLFDRSELDRVVRLMPELEPFLSKAIHPKANVFFLNPLVIHAGGSGVAPHADKTLVSFVAEGEPPFPFAVSVLYLSLPAEKQGGELVFHRLLGKLRRRPEENMLIEFPGWMLHEVTPLSSLDGSPPRVSLVLEQYHVTEQMRAGIPNWSLETTRPFSEFLDEASDEEPLSKDLLEAEEGLEVDEPAVEADSSASTA